MEENKNHPPTAVTETEMLQSLQRSGYLLESAVARQFVDKGFFVETNQVVKDPFTGKSREIDLQAQNGHYDEESGRLGVYVNIHFTCEIKNNLYPTVLLTPYFFTPFGDERGGLKQGQTGSGFQEELDIDKFPDLFSIYSSYPSARVYTQYCSFTRKDKGKELMAEHPEALYAGLSKITQCCEEFVEYWNNYPLKDQEDADRVHRNLLYLPVVILKDDLYELNVNGADEHVFTKVPYSRLLFSYHYKEVPQSAMVYFVSQPGLDSFIDNMLKAETLAKAFMIAGLNSRPR